MAISTKAVSIGGADLQVEERGCGEPLVLLHGMTGVGADFRHLFDLDALQESYRVIIPDARGHGLRSGFRGRPAFGYVTTPLPPHAPSAR